MMQVQSRGRRPSPPQIEADDGEPLLLLWAVAAYLVRPVHTVPKSMRDPVKAAHARLYDMMQAKLIRGRLVRSTPGNPAWYLSPGEAATAAMIDEASAFGLPLLFQHEIAKACRSWGPGNPKPDCFSDEVTPALAALTCAFDSSAQYILRCRFFVNHADLTQRLTATSINDIEQPAPFVSLADGWAIRSSYSVELSDLLQPLALRIFATSDPAKLQ